MAYSSRNGSQSNRRPPQQQRRRSVSSSNTRRSPQRERGSAPRNPSGSRGRTSTRSRNLTGPDTGYSVHSHRVDYRRRNAASGNRGFAIDGRTVVLIAIVIIVVIVLIAGISSCVSSNSAASSAQENENTTQEEQKPRVASGLSQDLTNELNQALDRDDQLAQIAQNADQYDDTRLIELALREPEAVSFVANYLTADKSASSYGDTVTKGQVPQLYDWDTRWGYATYGNGCIGVTGSAPTTVAMAYMGLTGKSDQTPATIAQSAAGGTTSSKSSSSNGNANSSANANSNTSNSTNTNGSSTGTSSASDSADSVIAMMSGVGLSATSYESSSDTLNACLSSSSVAAVYVKDNGFVNDSDAHWALVVGMNDDGSLNVFDPTSSFVSTRAWTSGTVAQASSTILYVTVSDTAASSDEDTDSETMGTANAATNATNANSTSSNSSTSSSNANSGSANSSGSTNRNTSNSNSSSSNRNANSSGSSTSGTSGSSSTSTSSSSSSASSDGSSDDGDYIGL